MMNFLKMVTAGFFLIAGTLTATAASEQIERLFSPTVQVETSVGSCSGVHFEQGRVLTAGHCFPKRLKKRADLSVLIDGQKGTLQWVDRDMDVAEVRYLSGGVLPNEARLNCHVRLDKLDTIIAIGFPFGIGEVITMGRVALRAAKIGPWEHAFIHTAVTAPGSSGGPIFNLHGDIVGIVVGGYKGVNLNMAVPSYHICPRVNRSLEIS